MLPQPAVILHMTMGVYLLCVCACMGLVMGGGGGGGLRYNFGFYPSQIMEGIKILSGTPPVHYT